MSKSIGKKGTDPYCRADGQAQSFGSIHRARISQYTTFLNMGTMDNIMPVDKSQGDRLWWTIIDIVVSGWGDCRVRCTQELL